MRLGTNEVREFLGVSAAGRAVSSREGRRWRLKLIGPRDEGC
jgi:hypothetical protein